jgi:hypothetical protein
MLPFGCWRAKGANEPVVHQAREEAHQQWARVTPDVVRATDRFPRVSHVQHSIYS